VAKSLQTEFVKYYKEKLEPFGFQKVKSRQPYFVRVINDEIIHVITYIGTTSVRQGYKAFHLVSGIATVYRKEINFSVPPSHNSDWMITLGTIYEKKETEYPVVKLPRDLRKFYYNDDCLVEIMKDTYGGIKELIHELDRVSNMDEVLKYLLKYNARNVSFMSLLDNNFSDAEGLFYARKEYDCIKIAKIFADKRFELKSSDWDESKKEITMTEILEWEERLKVRREEFIGNDMDYGQGMKLLKEHYNQNVERLKNMD